jgi:hypothetical protein
MRLIFEHVGQVQAAAVGVSATRPSIAPAAVADNGRASSGYDKTVAIPASQA